MPGNSQDDPQKQAQNLNLRAALSSAYAAIEGEKAVQSLSALTFDELANAQLQRIMGPDTPTRPNELNAVQKVLNDVLQAAQQIQSMPPENFQDPNQDRDVNTPVTYNV